MVIVENIYTVFFSQYIVEKLSSILCLSKLTLFVDLKINSNATFLVQLATKQ